LSWQKCLSVYFQFNVKATKITLIAAAKQLGTIGIQEPLEDAQEARLLAEATGLTSRNHQRMFIVENLQVIIAVRALVLNDDEV
jgi:hypothetical protein